MIKILDVVNQAREFACIVSAYVTLTRKNGGGYLDTFFTVLKESVDRGVPVTVMVNNSNPKEEINRFVDAGCTVYRLTHLHSKLYCNEKETVITSFNLSLASIWNNKETGHVVPTTGDILSLIDSYKDGVAEYRPDSTASMDGVNGRSVDDGRDGPATTGTDDSFTLNDVEKEILSTIYDIGHDNIGSGIPVMARFHDLKKIVLEKTSDLSDESFDRYFNALKKEKLIKKVGRSYIKVTDDGYLEIGIDTINKINEKHDSEIDPGSMATGRDFAEYGKKEMMLLVLIEEQKRRQDEKDLLDWKQEHVPVDVLKTSVIEGTRNMKSTTFDRTLKKLFDEKLVEHVQENDVRVAADGLDAMGM
jgi:hypothetical protein